MTCNYIDILKNTASRSPSFGRGVQLALTPVIQPKLITTLGVFFCHCHYRFHLRYRYRYDGLATIKPGH